MSLAESCNHCCLCVSLTNAFTDVEQTW